MNSSYSFVTSNMEETLKFFSHSILIPGVVVSIAALGWGLWQIAQPIPTQPLDVIDIAIRN